jgi:hypothetical protein
LTAASNKRKKRIEVTAKVFEEAKKLVGGLDKRDTFIAGIALYAAEGDKQKGGFANTDPKLVVFMKEWMVDYLKLPNDKFRGALWLHEGLSEEAAKKFWSDLLDLPNLKFHKTYISKLKKDSKKIRKNIHSYGVFSLRFSDTQKHRVILGWISAFFPGKINSVL